MVALLFVVFIALIILRVPVAFALLLSSLAVIVADGLPPVLIVQKVFEGLTPFPILAIPLFYLVGLLCNSGGFTDRIMNLAGALVGGFPGGLAQVNIVASMLFAGLSGSSTADVAGIGNVIMPAMLKAGYSRPLTVAVTACSSTMGVIIPPSILMVIYGALGNVSIGMLFLGGVVPGVLLGLGQMALVYVLARRHDFGRIDRRERPPLIRAALRAALPLGVPVVIIGGTVGGIFTPTESAAVAAVFVVLVSALVIRELTPSGLATVLRDGGAFVALPLIMTATAAVFAWLLAYYEFPTTVAGLADDFGGTRVAILLFVVIVFLVVGCFLDSIPAIIMFLPVIQELGNVAGVHPVQLGVVVILTLALGLITPPYGVCLLLAAKLVNLPPQQALGMTFLFALASLGVILLAVLVPDITLLLPRLLMGEHF
jgi:tripartite ATP-independent transporter DctM subunit